MADVCISTVADRHALHSVYYSAMKKAALHLTKRVFDACATRRIIVNATQMQRDIARNERAAHCRTRFAAIAKTSMK
jgi:hypothetical protein